MTPIAGVHHVQVAAPPGCEEAARLFYGGLLGFSEIDKPPLLATRGGCWFRAGASELHIGVEDPFLPATKAHPAFFVHSVEMLDELASSLAERSIEVRWADDAEIPAFRRFHVSDPWGNRIELLTVATG